MKILQPKTEIQKLELCSVPWHFPSKSEKPVRKLKIESLGPAYHFNLKNIVKCENKHVGLTYFDIF